MCDLHFKIEENQTKMAVATESDRYFGQTDRQTLKWFYICPIPCIALVRQ